MLLPHTIGLELERQLIATLDVEGTPIARAWNVIHPPSKLLSPAAEAFSCFMLDSADDRLTRLEVKLSYTEDLVDTLNKLEIPQQDQIQLLLREVRQLRRRCADDGQPRFRGLRDELPSLYRRGFWQGGKQRPRRLDPATSNRWNLAAQGRFKAARCR